MAGSASETIPVRDAHRFDLAPLAALMREKLGSREPISIEQMRGGQSNPTFLLRDAAGNEWVLRKQPPGKLLPSAHAVDREYRVLAALHPAGIPVPKPVLFSDDRAIVGTPFYLMERMRGRIFRGNDLAELPREARRPVYEAMADTLARLHSVDPAAIGLGDFGKTGNYYARQTARWTEQWKASKQREIESLAHLVEWLPANLPADGDEARICHGDFRLDNLMFDAAEPKVIAIFDWELSTLGPPLADLAYNCIPFHLPDAAVSGLAGKDLAALGLPTEAEHVARYLAAAHRTDGPKPFHVAFAMFRLAVILEGVLARARAGNASSESAEAMGRLGERFAVRAWEIAQGKG